ncbi:MAG TPA: hypothetical protein VNK43_02025 [Gemmatimonadales bacterium]|nr:hypothetical protein [Gemmatimonadales bacterium]
MQNRIIRFLPNLELLLTGDDPADRGQMDGADARVPLELRIGRSVLEAVLVDNIAAVRRFLARPDLLPEEEDEASRLLRSQSVFLELVRRDQRVNLPIGLYFLPEYEAGGE